MKMLQEQDKRIEGASDGLEIIFNNGESTIVKYDESHTVMQHVYSVCDLNDVSTRDVVSAQIIRHCLYM